MAAFVRILTASLFIAGITFLSVIALAGLAGAIEPGAAGLAFILACPVGFITAVAAATGEIVAAIRNGSANCDVASNTSDAEHRSS